MEGRWRLDNLTWPHAIVAVAAGTGELPSRVRPSFRPDQLSGRCPDCMYLGRRRWSAAPWSTSTERSRRTRFRSCSETTGLTAKPCTRPMTVARLPTWPGMGRPVADVQVEPGPRPDLRLGTHPRRTQQGGLCGGLGAGRSYVWRHQRGGAFSASSDSRSDGWRESGAFYWPMHQPIPVL